MTEEQLRTAVWEALTTEIAQRVSQKLIELQKKALVVCTGSTMGFPLWMVGLQQLQQAGFQFDLYLSQSAAQILNVGAIQAGLNIGKVYLGSSDEPPEKVAMPYPTILVPAMTINTAAKIASCTADTPAARVIFNSMLRGKNVVVAVDGCCPDNSERAAKGYRMTPAVKEQLRANLERMRDFGAVLTTAEAMASKTLRLIGAGGEDHRPPAACTREKAPAAPGEVRYTGGRIVGRGAVAGLSAGAVLRIPKGCQVTQLARDTAAVRGVTLVME